MPHRYADFHRVNGDLGITLTTQGREIVQEAHADGQNIDADQFMHDLFEWQTCNGWEWIAPEKIGALTDAPILTDSAERDDEGQLTSVGRVYWFPSFQVESPVRRLTEQGVVTFTGVSAEHG